MGIHPEKNDVDISKLYNWGKEVSIYDTSGKEIMSCAMRIVGDADLNRARIYGLRESAKLRAKLKDKSSDEFIALFPDLEDLDTANLVEVLVMLTTKGMYEQASKEVTLAFPKEPESTATIEELEIYQSELDSYDERLHMKLVEYITEKVNKEREKVSGYDRDVLYFEILKLSIKDMCENAMYKSFMAMCVTMGSYADTTYTQRLFKSVEEFNQLPEFIRNQFLETYASLDISMDGLKK